MKERHPIDDLFREGLYASEAEPPAEVWQRVVAQRSWGHRVLAGLQRRWAIALLAVALIGTPLAWYAAQAEDPALASSAVQPAQDEPAPSELASTATQQGTDGSARSATTTTAGDPASGSAPANVTDFEADESPVAEAVSKDRATSSQQRAEHPTKPTGAALGIDNEVKNNGAVDRGTTSSTSGAQGSGDGGAMGSTARPTDGASDVASEVHATNAAAQIPDRNASPAKPVMVEVGAEDYVDEGFLLAHSRPIPYSHFPDSLLTSDRMLEAPYLLANGAWWIGVQFGWSEWNGGWTGSSPLVEELDHAETWQNGWHAGVVGGRTWKSGLSMSLGVEMANLKSRFLFNEKTMGDSSGGYTTVLDTTWQANAVAPDSSYIVYTYSIDMVEVPIGGERDVLYSATNRYTLLNVPVELAWQKNVKRFTFAPRIGVSANFFMDRKGSTLVTNTSDGRATSVSANDARADERFGMLLCGSAGLDVGYALNERVQFFVGPGYSTVLASLGSDALRPTISGVSLRGRLVYEFGMKQRKAKP